MLSYCGAGEDSWGSLGQQGDETINPKGNQPWIFIGRTNIDAEAPIIWSPDVKSQLTGKAPDAGKDWGQEKKEMTENEMVGWSTDSMDMRRSKLQGMVEDGEAWRAATHVVAESDTT